MFWRATVAVAGGAGIVTGLYPVVPQIGLALMRHMAGRPQPRRLGRIIFLEWALAVAVQAVRPAGFFGIPVPGPPARGPRPVVLLHGFGQGNANFLVLGNRLHRAGLGPLYGFEYWTLGKVTTAARRLGVLVEEVCARHGAAKVDLVGHSMGGVVARTYVSLFGGAERVRHLVTIGSPHHGTSMAKLGLGWPTVELDASSELLRTLAAAPPPGVEVTCIWSRADGLVSTRREASVPFAEELVYEDLGHLSLLFSRRVADAIGARLRW